MEAPTAEGSVDARRHGGNETSSKVSRADALTPLDDNGMIPRPDLECAHEPAAITFSGETLTLSGA
ncbi:hypothetical protein [Burkholderia cenocepacia]|uniref:hypothetical protein n=1 Tax=Burkholderia cenocepacia TaxID=95486 RepID=UPI0011B5BA07|nr:hypothetical protein [Burkholderia cenocepacia]MDN7545060.1 hypothetical protein [Burkholderia cenocepacia]